MKSTKSYYVDRIQDLDVVCSHKIYLQDFFPNKIYEHCWVQVSKWKYDMLKRTKSIITVKVEGGGMRG